MVWSELNNMYLRLKLYREPKDQMAALFAAGLYLGNKHCAIFGHLLPSLEEVIEESSTQLSKTERLRQGPLYDCACNQGLSMERPGIPFPPAR